MAKIASSNGSKTTPAKPGSSNKGGRQISDGERQEIEKLAYQFFVERGYQHGNDAEDWARAEAIVKSRRS